MLLCAATHWSLLTPGQCHRVLVYNKDLKHSLKGNTIKEKNNSWNHCRIPTGSADFLISARAQLDTVLISPLACAKHQAVLFRCPKKSWRHFLSMKYNWLHSYKKCLCAMPLPAKGENETKRGSCFCHVALALGSVYGFMIQHVQINGNSIWE